MKILNLSEGFNPFPKTSTELLYESFVFSGGEVHIKLLEHADEVFVSIRLNNSDAIMKLLLAVDALRRNGAKKIKVIIPYLPYARQDRVMVGGEPLSIKVMCNLLNDCRFDQIYLFDTHSDVPLALLNNCTLINNHSLVKVAIGSCENYLLVSPDAGALKKIYMLGQVLDYRQDIVLCNKIREVSTGKIMRLTIDKTDLEGRTCFIVDDICDGGATFLSVAKELRNRNAGKISLIVSHGIMSKGEQELSEWIDHIYTTDSIETPSSRLVTRFTLSNLIDLT